MINNRILLTGAKGQLGLELASLIPNAILTDIDSLDITQEDKVFSFIKEHEVELIINCAAFTNVDLAEESSEYDNCWRLNALAPEILGKTNCKVIHISTDYVFDGNACNPYLPDSITNPLSVYGKTKLEGEQRLLDINSNAIVIRTSWLYSPHNRNFVKTIYQLASNPERKTLNVISDQVGTPTSATDLAKAIVQLIPMYIQNPNMYKDIYHYSNEGVCSWYDFAYEIVSFCKLDCNVLPINSDEYPTKAKRPCYSVLDKKKIKQAFNLQIPHWTESLHKCLKQF